MRLSLTGRGLSDDVGLDPVRLGLTGCGPSDDVGLDLVRVGLTRCGLSDRRRRRCCFDVAGHHARLTTDRDQNASVATDEQQQHEDVEEQEIVDAEDGAGQLSVVEHVAVAHTVYNGACRKRR